MRSTCLPGSRNLAAGEVAEYEGGLLSKTPEDQFRVAENRSRIGIADQSLQMLLPCCCIDLFRCSQAAWYSARLQRTARLRTDSLSKRENMLIGETENDVTGGEMLVPRARTRCMPHWLLLSGVGDNVFLAWEDGRLIRISTQDLEEAQGCPRRWNSSAQPGAHVNLLAISDRQGDTAGGRFDRADPSLVSRPTRRAATNDGATLVAAHELPRPRGRRSPAWRLPAATA